MFAKGIKKFSNLDVLDLNNNRITDSSIVNILKSMSINTKVLNLAYNNVGMKGCDYIIKIL